MNERRAVQQAGERIEHRVTAMAHLGAHQPVDVEADRDDQHDRRADVARGGDGAARVGEQRRQQRRGDRGAQRERDAAGGEDGGRGDRGDDEPRERRTRRAAGHRDRHPDRGDPGERERHEPQLRPRARGHPQVDDGHEQADDREDREDLPAPARREAGHAEPDDAEHRVAHGAHAALHVDEPGPVEGLGTQPGARRLVHEDGDRAAGTAP
ncbi:MAG: hypothetical protein MUF56_09940 [Solirubrobacteraceae bacterium]|nr:hypothetical protein [Solirubrobacteraceae bacterium]